LDEFLRVHQMPGDVCNQTLASLLVQHLCPEHSGLRVVVLVSRIVSSDFATPILSMFDRVLAFNWTVETVWMIIRRSSLMCHALGSVTLSVANCGLVRTIDGQLTVVGAQTVEMGVRVGEQAALKHAIW